MKGSKGSSVQKALDVHIKLSVIAYLARWQVLGTLSIQGLGIINLPATYHLDYLLAIGTTFDRSPIAIYYLENKRLIGIAYLHSAVWELDEDRQCLPRFDHAPASSLPESFPEWYRMPSAEVSPT